MSSGIESRVPEDLRNRALQQVQALVSDLAGVSAAIVATVDGFDIAADIRNNCDAERMAALASSISAIGDVVSEETGLGRARSVLIGTDSGWAVIHGVQRADIDLVIIVVAGSSAVLGQVNYRTAEAVKALAA